MKNGTKVLKKSGAVLKKLNVLIGCEESQEVCKAFRELGHEAFSCDLQECSGGKPDWHLNMSIFEAVKIKQWDILIAHPPCTFLSTVGNRYFNIETCGDKAIDRWRKRIEGLQFFYDLWNCGIEKICLENPQGFLGTAFRKADQIIHPYYFGDCELKRTHLWLKGLPKLKYQLRNDLFDERTASDTPQPLYIRQEGKTKGKKVYFTEANFGNAKLRSKTFPGIAKAMAEQWSAFCISPDFFKTELIEKASYEIQK